MSLNDNALITVDEFLTSLGMTRDAFGQSFFSIYNSSADATSATITKAGNVLTLTVVGGVNVHSTALTLTDAANDTIGELVAVITALSKGWVVKRLCASAQDSTQLYDMPATSALAQANELTLSGCGTLMIEEMINGASTFIDSYCGHVFKSSSAYTEYYDGNGRQLLQLNNFPIITITSVQVYDYETSTVLETLTENTDYIAYSKEGTLRKGSYWAFGHKNYKVVYTAGYTTVPEDLKLACKIISGSMYSTRGKAGYSSESIGNYSYTLASPSKNAQGFGSVIPADAIAILDKYKDMGFNDLRNSFEY